LIKKGLRIFDNKFVKKLNQDDEKKETKEEGPEGGGRLYIG
jgi:hypothetical protein